MIELIKSGKIDDKDERNKALKALDCSTAKDIMTKDCITVRPDTSIEDFIILVKENSFNTFPVTNDEGILLGIVAVFDVIKMI